MAVSIEVHSSRIGSHHNFIHCRNRLHCLKGKLWNQILLMLYLNTFYFPYLKSQLKKEKGDREICHWYIQMVRYHAVYVTLLLRLSNDVEENPGPRTINDIVDPTIDNLRNGPATQAKVYATSVIRFTWEPCNFTLNTFQDFVFTYSKQEQKCECNYRLLKLFREKNEAENHHLMFP